MSRKAPYMKVISGIYCFFVIVLLIFIRGKIVVKILSPCSLVWHVSSNGFTWDYRQNNQCWVSQGLANFKSNMTKTRKKWMRESHNQIIDRLEIIFMIAVLSNSWSKIIQEFRSSQICHQSPERGAEFGPIVPNLGCDI